MLFEFNRQIITKYFLGVLVSCLPVPVSAAVTINEIAWMGNDVSANDEWIELYNSGDGEVILDGWVITDNKNLDIALSGTLQAGSYAVLERTDDNSAPGSAFLIYTGALTNTGATLTLKRSDGSLEDQVAGGKNWENIGGDNTTKETAQYTSAGWITAAPTPGRVNATVDSSGELESENEPDTTTNNDSVTTPSSNNNDTGSIISGPLDDDFGLEIKAPSIVYVNQEFNLDAEPAGVSSSFLNRIKYTWNLGDGGRDRHRYIKYSYKYPGKYVVVLSGKYRRSEQVARHTITVLPVKFSITRNSEGDVQINNDAKYEINLSGYRISGSESVFLPDNTILLPGSTITIPKEQLDANYGSLVRLFDEESVLVASTNMQNDDRDQVENMNIAAKSEPPTEGFVFERTATTSGVVAGASTTREAVEVISTTDEPLNSDDRKTESSDEMMPYLALIGVMALGVVGLLVGKKPDL